ncbi:MAG: hypothetical protein U0T75_02470 [Chitinophagales bacterium]
MKLSRLLLLFLFVPLVAFSNSAMPGFWSGGAAGEFYPLYKEDSIHLGKIQMQSEEILVHLYPGFAVVKGTYHMLNTTNEPVTLHTGYPVNGHLSNREVYSVQLSDIYGLKVLVNDSVVAGNKQQSNSDEISDDIFRSSSNWYVWQMTYAPKAITTITVYFMVNTQNAVLRKGYDRKEGNAFTYVLESGRAWKDSIGDGTISVFLKGEVGVRDIFGIIPQGRVLGNDTFLYYQFKNLEPSDTDNLIIWYKQIGAAINFDSVAHDSVKWYAAMDLPVLRPATSQLIVVKAFDFKVSQLGSTVIGLVMLAVVALPILLGLLIVGLIVWYVVKRRKKKRQQAESGANG